MDGDVPRYALPSLNLADLRAAYLAKDITYLLGMDDTDPDHHQLDQSCAGEAQGPTRLQRGLLYAAAMRTSGASVQTALKVPGSATPIGACSGLRAAYLGRYDRRSPEP